MAEAVSLALGAIARLDPIYKGCQDLWNAYQTASMFGADYSLLSMRLRTEEFFFDRSLQYFHTYLMDHTTTWGNENSELRELIKAHIITILEVFNMCYDLVRTYDTNRDAGDSLSPRSLGDEVERAKRLAGSLGIHDSNPKRQFLAQRLDLQGALRVCRNHFKSQKQQKPLNGKQPDIESYFGTISRQKSMASSAFSSLRSRVQFVNGCLVSEQDLPGESGPSAEALYLEAKAELSQKGLKMQEQNKMSKKIMWANHGKEKFEAIIDILNKLNKALNELLPPLKLENNPLLVLRGPAAQPPTILKDTKRVRRGLEGLHKAIAVANQSSDGHSARFAVQLEDDHEDARLWMENSGLLNGLNQDSSCVFVGMMGSVGTSDVLAADSADLIVAGTILRARQDRELKGLVEEILKLRSHKVNGAVEGSVYQEIGDIEFAPDRIYNLRRVTAPGTSIQKQIRLEDMIEDAQKLPPKERINLAAKIALSHVHFASVNLGPCPRQPRNYRFYKQSYEDDPSEEDLYEAKETVFKTPWLDHRFGVPVAPKRPGALTSRTAATQQKVDAAQELGVLLYQLTSGKLIQPISSQMELAAASEDAKKSIGVVQDLCGLRVREVVELCLSYNAPKAGDEVDSTLDLLQEVTYALQRCRRSLETDGVVL